MIYLASYQPQNSPEDRKTEHRLGRLLLKFGLEKEYGQVWEVEIGPHGKPFLRDCPDLDFSISHSRGLAACAIHTGPVGLDVQLITHPSPALIRRVLSQEEQKLMEQAADLGTQAEDETFTRLWTLKESYTKAIGLGLGYPLKQLSFCLNGDGSVQGNTPGFVYVQRKIYGKYIISLCHQTRDGKPACK